MRNWAQNLCHARFLTGLYLLALAILVPDFLSAATWYVRPVAANGTYGLENGTSYANAFNGLTAAGRAGKGIIWGNGGVKGGDTLYVCGNHWLKTTQGSQSFTYGRIAIPVQGISDDQPLCIRGDYPGDSGLIWGYGRNSNLSDTWNGPDANGVYWINRDLGQFIAEDIDKGTAGSVYLNEKTVTTWSGERGAFCRSGGRTYVKTSNGASPAGRLYTGNIPYRFALFRNQYIQFKNLTFNGYIMDYDRDENGILVTSLPRSTHITFDGCTMRYGSQIFFRLYDGHDYWRFINCTMEYAPSAINTLGNMGGDGASYLLVKGCTFRHLGVLMFPHQDAHGVGIRRGHDNVIERNTFEDTGTAIEFWTSIGAPMRNMTVRHNYIENIKVKQTTTGNGIAISGENGHSIGERTGFKIYGNIITNTEGDGISSNNKDYIEVMNNVVHNTADGISLEVVGGYAVKATVKNNIIANPRENFVEVGGVNNELEWDNNLYYSSAGSTAPLWKHWGSFSVWSQEMGTDHNSLIANPDFVSVNPQTAADFKLKANSPAIDAGANVGLSHDFEGRLVPRKNAPDIGAYEFDSVFFSAAQVWRVYE